MVFVFVFSRVLFVFVRGVSIVFVLVCRFLFVVMRLVREGESV